MPSKLARNRVGLTCSMTRSLLSRDAKARISLWLSSGRASNAGRGTTEDVAMGETFSCGGADGAGVETSGLALLELGKAALVAAGLACDWRVLIGAMSSSMPASAGLG